MISCLRGVVIDVEETSITIDVNGIGFEVLVAPATAARLAGALNQDEVLLHTYMNVDREGAMSLFGFDSKDDLRLFKLLITVSGVGPKGAQSLLSSIGADALRFAIISGDAKTIARAPGIGKKTAERLVIDLRDRLEVQTAEFLTDTRFSLGDFHSDDPGDTDADEAVQALAALGYSRADAVKAVKKAKADGREGTEDILKGALMVLAG